jgi:hypothetical protein
VIGNREMETRTTTETAIDDIIFDEAEIEAFSAARLAGDGLRRGFDAWVAIGHATEIARRHADMPGGTQRIRGARAILDREGLPGGILFCELEPMPATGARRQTTRIQHRHGPCRPRTRRSFVTQLAARLSDWLSEDSYFSQSASTY